MVHANSRRARNAGNSRSAISERIGAAQAFSKAAQEVGVSQPAFSMRIRNLEERLGTTIVRRGNRYQGLTTEGEAILRHARRILDDVRFLEQEVLAAKGEISGTLSIGVVPTAAAFAAQLAGHLHLIYPGIVARIEDGTIDAGITYDDNVSGDMLTVQALYEEQYMLLTPISLLPDHSNTITWLDAAKLPLSLLEPRMQNRRILDRMFEEIGAQPKIVSETNALTISIVMACEGLAATVVPNVLLDTMGNFEDTVALPLVEPELRKSISLVTASRLPGMPTVEALRRAIANFP